MRRRDFLLAGTANLLALTVAPTFTFAQQAAGGFTDTRLDAIRAMLQADVDAGRVSGLVYLLARGNEVHVETLGTTRNGGGEPMRRDTIFRIMSMTKPVIAVATLMLVEDGKLSLDEPAERLLPELANRQVLTAVNAPLDSTVPAERPFTVRELLNFTFGLGLQFDPALPIQAAIMANQLANDIPIPQTPHQPDEWMRRLGTLPLMAQPGEVWMYNSGSLVLGVLIARASGQKLEDFLRTRIFEPLGMVDTAFWVPPEKRNRFLPSYGYDMATMQPVIDDEPEGGQWSAPPPFPSGAGGLVSTLDDYLAFARMLLNRGEYNGQRLLSEESVAEMTSDQLTPEQRAGGPTVAYAPDFSASSWGYGVQVSTGPDDISDEPGRYGWNGGYGASWINDPGKDLTAIILSNNAVYFISTDDFKTFKAAVYDALSE